MVALQLSLSSAQLTRDLLRVMGEPCPPRLPASGSRELGTLSQHEAHTSWLSVRRDGAKNEPACRYVTANSRTGEPLDLEAQLGAEAVERICAQIAAAVDEAGVAAQPYRRAPGSLRTLVRSSFARVTRGSQERLWVLLPPRDGGRPARVIVRLPTTAPGSPAAHAPDDLPPFMRAALRLTPERPPLVARALAGVQTPGQAVLRLTPRERLLGQALVLGEGNAELAQRAGISVNRVEQALGVMASKLGVRGRARMVRLLVSEKAVALEPARRLDTLTPLQRQLLLPLCEGATMAEAGAPLGLDKHAVAYQLDKVARAWGARSPLHVQALALTAGLLPPLQGTLPRAGLESLPPRERAALTQMALGRTDGVVLNVLRTALDRLGLDEPWQAAALLRLEGSGRAVARQASVALRGVTGVDALLLRMLAAGWGSGKMGAALGLSGRVLDERLAQLCAKWGFHNPLEASCAALEAGLIPPPTSFSRPPPPWTHPGGLATTWREGVWRLSAQETQLFHAVRRPASESSVRKALGWSVALFNDVSASLRIKLRAERLEAVRARPAPPKPEEDAPLSGPALGPLQSRDHALLRALAEGEPLAPSVEHQMHELRERLCCTEPYQLTALALDAGLLPLPLVQPVEQPRAVAALPSFARETLRGIAAGMPLEAIAERHGLTRRELEAQLGTGSELGWLAAVGLRAPGQVPGFVRALGWKRFNASGG